MKNINIVAVGSDPEVFFTKDGAPHSVEGLVGGTKNEPRPMKGLPDGFFIQEDNVAAEYNIPPATSVTDFVKNITEGLKYVHNAAVRVGMQVAIVPCLDFPARQLTTPHARRLGCDPDLNVWKLEFNPTPTPPKTMRTAAGHVHISWVTPDKEQQVAVGKLCDVFLGMPSILVTKPSARRDLYGKAGAVRIKPYGVEYRTLDNFWLTNEKWMAQVYSNVQQLALRVNREKDILMDSVEDFAEEIQDCINTHSERLATLLCDRFDVPRFA